MIPTPGLSCNGFLGHPLVIDTNSDNLCLEVLSLSLSLSLSHTLSLSLFNIMAYFSIQTHIYDTVAPWFVELSLIAYGV